MNSKSHPGAPQNGFILASTLWFCAILILLAGYFTYWTQSTLEEAAAERQQTQHLIDRANTRNTLIYLFTVQPMTFAGLTTQPRPNRPARDLDGITLAPEGDEIRLDNRPYSGFGNIRFSVQDERGLISLHHAPRGLLERLLETLGAEPKQIPGLKAKLQDYTDPDDFHRLNGAEAPHYRAAGLRPPPNRDLTSPYELTNILGWSQQPALFKDAALPRLTSTVTAGAPNPNTAPQAILQTLPGIDAVLAERIILQRQEAPIRNPHDLRKIIGSRLPYDSQAQMFLPANAFRLDLWHADQPSRITQWAIRITPDHDRGAPWQIDYRTRLPYTIAPANANAQTVASNLFHPVNAP